MNTDFRWFVVKKKSNDDKNFEIIAGFFSLELAKKFLEYISIVDLGEFVLYSDFRPYYSLLKKQDIYPETQE